MVGSLSDGLKHNLAVKIYVIVAWAAIGFYVGIFIGKNVIYDLCLWFASPPPEESGGKPAFDSGTLAYFKALGISLGVIMGYVFSRVAHKCLVYGRQRNLIVLTVVPLVLFILFVGTNAALRMKLMGLLG